VTTVSAASAATALGDVPSRLAALDVGVPAASLSAASASLRAYSKKRAARAALERELETSLPPSAAGLDGGERDLEMLEHWAGELEGFEERRKGFFERAAKEVGEAEDEADPAPPSPASDPLSPPSLADLAVPLRAASEAPPPDGGYELLEDLKSAIASFSQMFESASLSLAHLSSISEASSAVHALTQARDALYDVSFAPAHPLYDAVEDSHDLLTAAEKALSAAAAALEARVLQQMELRAPRLPLEEVDEVLAEWHTLARKHGVAPGALLSAGRAIRNELDGNNRARELLPAARREEEEALADYKEACRALTVERERAGELLGEAVSARLKDLGMSGAEFKVQVFERGGVDWEEGGGGKARWGGPGSGVGVDAVDFLLKNNNAGESKKKKMGAGLVGGWGKVEAVASSGERARILLLIETALPGAVAAAGGGVGGAEAEEEEEERGGQGEAGPGPVLTLYDEIDSHVGGRAAVAVARLLSRQGAEANQIVSITHNAAIGSVADEHLVVEKSEREEKGGGVRVTVGRVQGEDREREIARMAAGSMAETESLEFARAMLREGREHTQTHE
jgi:DNA repair ATPase RecN